MAAPRCPKITSGTEAPMEYFAACVDVPPIAVGLGYTPAMSTSAAATLSLLRATAICGAPCAARASVSAKVMVCPSALAESATNAAGIVNAQHCHFMAEL